MISLGDILGRRKGGDRLTPEEKFVRVDEDLMEVARELKPFLSTRAWLLLQALLQERRQEVAVSALGDTVRSKEWYQGYYAGTGSLQELVESVMGAAEAAKEGRDVERGVAERMGTSGGDFSV